MAKAREAKSTTRESMGALQKSARVQPREPSRSPAALPPRPCSRGRACSRDSPPNLRSGACRLALATSSRTQELRPRERLRLHITDLGTQETKPEVHYCLLGCGPLLVSPHVCMYVCIYIIYTYIVQYIYIYIYIYIYMIRHFSLSLSRGGRHLDYPCGHLPTTHACHHPRPLHSQLAAPRAGCRPWRSLGCHCIPDATEAHVRIEGCCQSFSPGGIRRGHRGDMDYRINHNINYHINYYINHGQFPRD